MQPNEQADCVKDRISKKLADFAPSSPEPFIFKVHERLRIVNKEAYEPTIVAIGPYHHGKENLQMMEEHKLRYLYDHLKQKGINNADEYINALSSLESEARSYYAESIKLSTDKFIEMLLLDGCFVIEVISKVVKNLRNEDPILQMDWMVESLQHDLMLFENQLPIFILCKLFDLIESPNNHGRFMQLALCFFNGLLPENGYKFSARPNSNNIKHLLGLIHNNWHERSKFRKKSQNMKSLRFIPSATELQEAGVEIKKAKYGRLFDITFENGVLQVPPLRIQDGTEAFLRNLIAYEQYYSDVQFSYICDYVDFIDCLINSKNDVEILCRCEIIDNWLGGTEIVCDIFNKITDEVSYGEENFQHGDIIYKINKHCGKRRHKWLAKLRRDYFNGPWAIISVAAAFILLVLTFVQTIFTVYSTFK